MAQAVPGSATTLGYPTKTAPGEGQNPSRAPQGSISPVPAAAAGGCELLLRSTPALETQTLPCSISWDLPLPRKLIDLISRIHISNLGKRGKNN